MANALVTVDFHGDKLEAVQGEDGKVWVSLRRCCENLGLSIQGQHEKLKGKPWACIKEILIHDASGRSQPAIVIDLDTLPGWLFSIDARKVKEQVREKLARYQREAARVLADHFLRKPQPPAITAETIRQLVREAMAEVRSQAVGPRWTVQQRLQELRWDTTSAKQRAQVRDLANSMIMTILGEEVEHLNGYCVYHRHQVHLLDRAIEIVRTEAERREFAGGYGLFLLAD